MTAFMGSYTNSSTAKLVQTSDSTKIFKAYLLVTASQRNVGNVEVGMMVELDQWDTMAMGVVESISLASTQNNGVASYPMVIAVDNSGEESNVQINSYINYKLTASENDNCLVLPIQCVRTVSTEEGETATVVYIQSEERPENAMDGVVIDEVIPEGFWPVPVEIGISDNYNVEIRSGVEEGTVVFTQNQVSNAFGYGF